MFFEEQQRNDVAARPARGRPRKTAPQRQVEFPTGLSPILSERRIASGVGPSGMSAMQPFNVEQYGEQIKRRIADRLQEDDRIYEQFRQERAGLIAESEIRLVDVRRGGGATAIRRASVPKGSGNRTFTSRYAAGGAKRVGFSKCSKSSGGGIGSYTCAECFGDVSRNDSTSA